MSRVADLKHRSLATIVFELTIAFVGAIGAIVLYYINLHVLRFMPRFFSVDQGVLPLLVFPLCALQFYITVKLALNRFMKNNALSKHHARKEVRRYARNVILVAGAFTVLLCMLVSYFVPILIYGEETSVAMRAASFSLALLVFFGLPMAPTLWLGKAMFSKDNEALASSEIERRANRRIRPSVSVVPAEYIFFYFVFLSIEIGLVYLLKYTFAW